MDVKNEFDINKICRACLTEMGEMRSVFLADESIGQAMILADMMMGFTGVQVSCCCYCCYHFSTLVQVEI